MFVVRLILYDAISTCYIYLCDAGIEGCGIGERNKFRSGASIVILLEHIVLIQIL
jgi:hypothetical protein